MEQQKKNNKKRPPAVGPAEREDVFGDPVFNLANAASANECTGLIQSMPENEDQMQNYEDVYSFSQPLPVDEEEDTSES